MSARLAVTPAYTGTVHRQFPAEPRKSRSERLSAEARRAWVVMRDEGGFYTAGELGALMLPALPPKLAAITASRWLCALRNRQHVAQNPLAKNGVSCGVTGRCFPIPGMSLDPTVEGFEP